MQNTAIGLVTLLVFGVLLFVFPPAFLAGIAIAVAYWMIKTSNAEGREIQRRADEERSKLHRDD